MRYIADRLIRRPLLIPAAVTFLGALLTIRTMSLLAVPAVAVLTAVVYLFSRCDRTAKGLSVLAATLLFLLMTLMSCYDVLTCTRIEGRADIDAVVTSCELRLDGSVRTYLSDREYGRLLLVSDDGEILPQGSAVKGRCSISMPVAPTNPGQFDYRSYLTDKGISGVIELEGAGITYNGSLLSRILSGVVRIPYRIRTEVTRLFGEDAAMAGALFMGDSSMLDEHVKRDFRICGCSHILAVSGTHFTGFLMIVPFILTSSGRKKASSVIVYSALCLLLAVLTGFSPSVTRACVMSASAFAVRDKLSALSMGALLLILADPFCAVSSSFLMSFSAGLSIIVLGRRIEDRIGSSVISVTLAAQLGMIPFFISNGAFLSFSSLLIQIISSFLAEIACVFFVPSVIISLIPGIVTPSALILRLLDLLLRAYSPYAMDSLSVGDVGAVPMIALLFLVLFLLLPESLIRKVIRYPAFILCAVSAGILLTGAVMRPSARIVFIDAGQGDSCLVMTGELNFLIDGGTEEAGKNCVEPVLDHYGIERLDAVFMSHWDEDHSGGIMYLISEGRVRSVYAPDVGSEGMIVYEPLYAGDTIPLPDGSVNVLYPESGRITEGSNDDSVVMLLDISGVTVLFTGDISGDVESHLTAEGLIPDIDILKVPHHGSRFSSTLPFLSAADPQTCIISAGRGNIYGHPAAETLERISQICPDEIYVTSSDGAITVEIYDNGYVTDTFIAHRLRNKN